MQKTLTLESLLKRIQVRENRIALITKAGAPFAVLVFEQQVVEDLRRMYDTRQIRLLQYTGLLSKEVTDEILDS